MKENTTECCFTLGNSDAEERVKTYRRNSPEGAECNLSEESQTNALVFERAKTELFVFLVLMLMLMLMSSASLVKTARDK